MKERPIIFIAPMVRALLDGRKTMTRRIVKPQPVLERDLLEPDNPNAFLFAVKTDVGTTQMLGRKNFTERFCPHQPSDRMWVKETFNTCGGKPFYRASGEMHADWKWKPSIFMPRWASRITLELTSVRVERVQDITETDAKSEGLVSWKSGYPRSTGCPPAGYITLWSTAELKGWTPAGRESPVQAYRSLWDSLNAKRGFRWETNPWVWAISFKVIKPTTAPGDPDAIDRAEYRCGRKGEP